MDEQEQNNEQEQNIVEQPVEFATNKVENVVEEVRTESTNDNSNALSITSLVCGILGLLMCFAGGTKGAGIVQLALQIIAIVTGAMARKREKSGMATAGMICGIVGLALAILGWILLLVGVATLIGMANS